MKAKKERDDFVAERDYKTFEISHKDMIKRLAHNRRIVRQNKAIDSVGSTDFLNIRTKLKKDEVMEYSRVQVPASSLCSFERKSKLEVSMKKIFVIQAYELHAASFECEAETEEEAIGLFRSGRVDYVEDSEYFIEMADKYHGTRKNGQNYPDGIRDIEIVQEADISKARQIEPDDILSVIKGETK